jgi:hypothetical protein
MSIVALYFRATYIYIFVSPIRLAFLHPRPVYSQKHISEPWQTT